MVDAEAFARELFSRMSEPEGVVRETAVSVRDSFVKLFCREFFRKRNQWPNCAVDASTRDDIKRSVEKNLWLEPGSHGWSPQDFRKVYLRKELGFDMFVDLTDLLTDKAVCSGRNSLIDNYDKCAYRAIYNRAPPRGRKRPGRVLEHFLTRPNEPL